MSEGLKPTEKERLSDEFRYCGKLWGNPIR